MKVKDKVIVVTGAGSGIGRELVLALVAKGAWVAGVDLNATSLTETGTLLRSTEDRFAPFVVNVSDQQAVAALPELVTARFGAVDGIINNAGIIQPFVKLQALDYESIHRLLNVNLFGTLYVTKAFLPLLIMRPEAHIANLSSMGGFVPVPGQTMYCAAKAAVKLMTEGLASELLGTSVGVSVVCPGAVATNIRGNSGLGEQKTGHTQGSMKALSPQEAATIIIHGIESKKYHIFVGRDAQIMDKLYRFNPQFAARTIAKKMRSLLAS